MKTDVVLYGMIGAIITTALFGAFGIALGATIFILGNLIADIFLKNEAFEEWVRREEEAWYAQRQAQSRRPETRADKLARMTVENGCTEAEAATARQKLFDLLMKEAV
jgi:hypothetical protein